jgi:hypothetical protein
MLDRLLRTLGFGKKRAQEFMDEAAIEAFFRSSQILDGPRTPETRSNAEYAEARNKAWEACNLFMTASMLIGSERTRSESVRNEVVAFIGGVADSVAQIHRLVDWDTLSLWSRLVSVHLRIPPRVAVEIVLSAIKIQEFQMNWKRLGGSTVRDWLSGRDPDAPLTLFERVVAKKI